METVDNAIKGSLSGGDRRQGADRKVTDAVAYDRPERRIGEGRRSNEARTRLETVLEPQSNPHFLLVGVVLMRVQQEFAYMETDEQIGRLHVEQLRKEIQTNTQNLTTQTKRLKNLQDVQDQAVYVQFGDNPSSETEYLSTVLIPGEPIRFNYESLKHQEHSRSLLERFARMLGYRITQ